MIGRNKPPEGDRTPEERARAAAERAARRAARTGEMPAVAPIAEPPPAPVAEEPPRVAEEPPRVAEEPPRVAEEPAPRRAAPPPVRAEPRVEPPPPKRSRRPAVPPAARRRPMPRAPQRPLPPSGPGERRTWAVRVLAVIALVVVGGALWGINAIFQPFHGDGRGAVEVTIEPGWDVRRIGDELAARGVVDSGMFFNLNATLTGNRGDLKPGDYELPRGMSYGDAVDALIQGPEAKVVPTFSLTIPEGRSRREVVPIVEEAELEGGYLKATETPAVLRAARELGLPKGSDNPEGFLFPATYELVKGGETERLVRKQLDAFADNFASVDFKAARRRNLTRYDVVIIASMVEREAQLDEERPLIAAVIHNRLREGIPLGIDATIRYAESNWTEPLKQSELQRPGPYNSRLNRGLPPTPIGNPGLKSLKAAAKPARVDYLYYVVKPGTCGEHAFSSTDAQFQRDVARYNAEREAAGGKSPTTC